uniref:Uncharacterized protein n=1 Tax=Stomoxys calcitrans TaxID=35570 RepID=A0A1I8Q517_STOCA
MKMVMSADSSDCHPSSSSVVVGAEAPSTSAKISVICHMSQQPQQQQTQTPNPQTLEHSRHSLTSSNNNNHTVEASAASSTTPGPQVIMGRSHLENALKLPPNTSVSAYYQNTKLMGGNNSVVEDSTPNGVVYPTNLKQEFNAPSQSSSSILYARSTMPSAAVAAASTAPVTDMDTVPTGAGNSSAASSNTSTNLITHIKLSPSPPCSSSSSMSSSQQQIPSVIYNNPLLKQQNPSTNSLILSQVLQQQQQQHCHASTTTTSST